MIEATFWGQIDRTDKLAASYLLDDRDQASLSSPINQNFVHTGCSTNVQLGGTICIIGHLNDTRTLSATRTRFPGTTKVPMSGCQIRN